MRKVYAIVQKMKKLDGKGQLSRREVALLLEYIEGYCRNLDPKENEGDYHQICDFVNMPREKFLEVQQKEEEEEERRKKLRKGIQNNPGKIL
jgi:hypothetical protein